MKSTEERLGDLRLNQHRSPTRERIFSAANQPKRSASQHSIIDRRILNIDSQYPPNIDQLSKYSKQHRSNFTLTKSTNPSTDSKGSSEMI